MKSNHPPFPPRWKKIDFIDFETFIRIPDSGIIEYVDDDDVIDNLPRKQKKKLADLAAYAWANEVEKRTTMADKAEASTNVKAWQEWAPKITDQEYLKHG